MKIFKIDGAENTFALVSFLDSQMSQMASQLENDRTKLSRLASEISNYKTLGVDGCVFIFPDKDLDFRWDFYNSDGSDALMCGNAARAVAFWYHHYVNSKLHIRYATLAQVVEAEILSPEISKNLSHHTLNNCETFVHNGQVKVYLRASQFLGHADLNDDGTQADKAIKASVYDSGVPHLCLLVPVLPADLYNFETIGQHYFEKAKSLRFPKILDHKGANVTIVWKEINNDENSIFAMSFERGVEDWTQACGTGAVAAAHFAKDNMELKYPIHVQMPGGVLEVSEMDGKMTLTGPAKVLKVIELDI